VPAPVEVRPTIDRVWLEREAAAAPLVHAYALWDLARTPHLVRFASALRSETTVGYLLLWLGSGGRPVVHWFGPPDLADALLPALPRPPFVAVVPPEVEPAVLDRFPEATVVPLRMMLREPGPVDLDRHTVRRLERRDLPGLQRLARASEGSELDGYAGFDPATDLAWGAFDGERLVGVARAAVRLPAVWVVGGVYVEPTQRDRGLGRSVVAAVVEEAERSGARAGLYVRDEAGPALRVYSRLGFVEVARRSWVGVPSPAGAAHALGGPRGP